MPIPSQPYRAGLAAAFVILVAGCILQTLGGTSYPEQQSTSEWGLDDAYISYRYAENLARGQGLVFNPGERVEGYSNFLYVLGVAPAFWLTDRDGVYFFSVLLNILFAACALWIFGDYLLRTLGERWAVAGTLLFALCLPLWAAVAGGLETSLQVLIAIAIWIWAERVVEQPSRRDVLILAVLSILSLLVRVDGFLIPGIAILYLLLKQRVRSTVMCAAALIGSAGIYELWRLYYYHALLPTTYYVKVAGSLPLRLSHATAEFARIALFEGLWPYILVLFGTLATALLRQHRRGGSVASQLRFELAFAPLWIGYWFYIGGDHFWDRFLIVLYPMGIFALLRAGVKSRLRPRLAYALLLLALVQAGTPWFIDSRFRYEFNKFDCWIGTGKFLGQRFQGKTLAVGALGKMPFFSGLYAVDMLGLADPVVAHMPAVKGWFEPGHVKFNADYTLSRRPDLIALSIFPNRDLSFGLTREKYERAGYHLEYLVDTRRPAGLGPHILQVGGVDPKAIAGLIASGYSYAVVIKN